MVNTQSIMIKRLAALLVAVFVVVVLAVPSFGYTDNSTNNVDFNDQPIPNAPYLGNSSDTYNARYVFGNENAYQYSVCATGADDIYCAGYFTNNNQTTYYILCASRTSGCSFTTCIDYGAGSYTISGQHRDMTSTYNDLYYRITSGTYNANSVVPSVPMFETLNDALNAINDWIDNPPVSSQPLSLALQPGNVAYIDITNTNATITLTQHTSVAYWQLTSTQYIGASNSLPSSGFTVPIAGTGMIDWVGVGRKTVQGQYNDWTSVNQISGSASDHQHVYAIVVNPLQNNVTTGSGLDVSSVANGIINISVDPAWSVKIYQLENQFSLGIDSNTQSGDTGTGTYDSNTGQWTYTNDQTGESFDQQFGGMTTPDSQFDSIHDFLENIANTISGFFSGAINAVSTLVGAGSSFFGVLGGLYSWLPPAVYSVLVSALIIVITIGVIKVFV